MTKPSDLSLAETIRQRRLEAGYSFERLAKRTGIPKTSLVDIEMLRSPQPRIPYLVALAEALELDVRSLVKLAGYPDVGELAELPVYLRAKYDISDEALRHLLDQFEFVKSRYGVRVRDPNTDS